MNKHTLHGQILLNVGTLLAVAVMLFAYNAWAAPSPMDMLPSQALGAPAANAVPGAISYQGTLTDASGKPITGNVNITFRLYAVPTGGAALWTEVRTGANAVPVSNGLFNVLLGSLTPIPANVWNNATVYLGVQVVGDTEMTPREVINMVPFAMSVADNSIITAKIAEGAVGNREIANAAITSDKLMRTIHRLQLPSTLPIPQPNTEYTALTFALTLERETLVTIFASVGTQNNDLDTLFRTNLYVSGNKVSTSESWNKTGIGETQSLHNTLFLGPGTHEITITVLSWAGNSHVVGGDLRTQLIVIEG